MPWHDPTLGDDQHANHGYRWCEESLAAPKVTLSRVLKLVDELEAESLGQDLAD